MHNLNLNSVFLLRFLFCGEKHLAQLGGTHTPHPCTEKNPPNGIWKPRLAGKFWARYPSFKTTLDDWSDQGSPMLHPFDLLAPSDFALWLNTRRARWRYDSAEMCEYHARVNTRILFRCLRCVNTVFGSHGHSYESHGGANWRPPTPAGPRA